MSPSQIALDRKQNRVFFYRYKRNEFRQPRMQNIPVNLEIDFRMEWATKYGNRNSGLLKQEYTKAGYLGIKTIEMFRKMTIEYKGGFKSPSSLPNNLLKNEI